MHLAFRVSIAVVLAVLAVALWWISASPAPQAQAPPLHLRLTGSPSPASAAYFIAEREGLLARHGLKVEFQSVAFGKLALDQVLAGKSDIALVAEFPVLLAALKKEEPLAILASIYQSNNEYQILARKDSGIATPGDLRGKRIGYPPGTSMGFFLDSYLLAQGIPLHLQQHIDVSPQNAAQTLVEGRVDAVVVFPPYNQHVKTALGERAVELSDNTIAQFNFCLVSTRAWAQANPQVVQRMLAAFIAATSKLRESPSASIAMLATELKMDPVALSTALEPQGHQVRLHTELLLTLELMQQWALRRKLVPGDSANEVRDMLWFDGLAQLAPSAITIRR